jgi:hypothetical protein
VQLVVQFQVRLLGELLATKFASVGFLTTVNPSMNLHVVLQAEILATDVARIGLNATMNEHMSF